MIRRNRNKYCNICFQVENQHIVVVSVEKVKTITIPMIIFPYHFPDEQMKIKISTHHAARLALKRDFSASVSRDKWLVISQNEKCNKLNSLFSPQKMFSSPPKKLRVIPRQLTNPQNHLSNHDLHVRLIRRPLAKWRAFKVGASSSFTYSGLITGDKYRKDSQAEIDGSGMAREVFYRSLAMDMDNEWWLS